MEEPTTTPPVRAAVKCPNCGYAIVESLPVTCSECGFSVIHRDPLRKDRPLHWPLRLLMIAWPLIGIAIGLPFLRNDALWRVVGPIFVFCFVAAFINSPVMLFLAAFRPPAFIAGEPEERAARRRRLTILLGVFLSLSIPVLLFGSCTLAFMPPH